jgi:hypothetical protein
MTKHDYLKMRLYAPFDFNVLCILFHAYHTEQVNATGQGKQIPFEAFVAFVNRGAKIWSHDMVDKVIRYFDEKYKIAQVIDINRNKVSFYSCLD